VDARLLDVFHDRAHEQLLAVKQGVNIDFDGRVQEAVDEEGAA
jgi:hypothetical protein